MFVLHIALLPLGILALLGIHLWLVRVLGISAEGPQRSLFSENLRRLTGVSLLLLAGVIGLSVAFPEGLGHPPIAGFEITKPFWPLLWIYALESTTGMWALIWAPVAVFAFLAAVPLLDRGSAGEASVLWLRVAGGVILIALIALGVWAAITPPQQHLGM
jgi:quinol-cytochrome oxidoreductase complex cytochrome b subunit